MPDWLSVAIVFVYGSIVGSFLNVLIWRLPRDESVVRPPSHCTVCGYTLRAWDNIPLISWLIYRGRCRNCGARISSRYFWIELFTGLLWIAVWYRFGWSLEFFQYAAVISALIAVFAIDLEHYIIPDQLWIFMAAVGFLAEGIGLALGWKSYPWNDLLYLTVPFTGGWELPVPHALLGFVVYGGAVLLVGILGEIGFKKEAMGGGDVKLAAAIGANIGATWGIVSFLIGAAIGTVIGIPLIVLGKRERMDYIPFGPMLVVGAIVMIFFGRQVVNWWLGYAGLR
ncbi:MAG: prepilin peptidase [Armatimonadetes bacterium]|nr:prepilin peptidase [Armatimonadota bacterium]